jgi:subtilisin family serine protease
VASSKISGFLIYARWLFSCSDKAWRKIALLVRPAVSRLIKGLRQGYAPITVAACPAKKPAVLVFFVVGIVSSLAAGALASPGAGIAPPAATELVEPVGADIQEGVGLPVEAWGHVSSEARSLSPDTGAASNSLVTEEMPGPAERDGPAVIDASNLPRITKLNRGVVVAVLDTGIDSRHEALSGLVSAEVNLVNNAKPKDYYGHGTHVAGIIAARENSQSVAGVVPGCSLLNVKVADNIGRCQAQTLAEGIKWAVENGACVINVSVRLNDSSPQLEEAVDYAWSQGCLVIAAASGYEGEPPVYPAVYESCVAVAGFTPGLEFSDYVDVVAPGSDICSTLPGNEYGYKSGSSFATAFVSGLAALLFDCMVDADGDGKLNDEVREALENGCLETVAAGYELTGI